MELESEKDIEKYLVDQVEALGGLCYKITSPGRKNVPDRVCLFPRGVTIWIEVKSEKEKPTDGQIREHERLRDRRHTILVIDTINKVNILIKEVGYELFERI